MAKQPRYTEWELKILEEAVQEEVNFGNKIGRELTTELMDTINEERARRGLRDERTLASIEYQTYKIYDRLKEE